MDDGPVGHPQQTRVQQTVNRTHVVEPKVEQVDQHLQTHDQGGFSLVHTFTSKALKIYCYFLAHGPFYFQSLFSHYCEKMLMSQQQQKHSVTSNRRQHKFV